MHCQTLLTNAEVSTSWIPSTVSEFYEKWYIIVEPVYIFYMKDQPGCYAFSAQDYYRYAPCLGTDMNHYPRYFNGETHILMSNYAYMMYTGCYTKQQTKSGNWVCTYDSKDHADLVYTEAQKANDEAECGKSYEDSSFFYANSGFGIYGWNFVMEAGQPSNIGMTVTYDINGSRIGSSVTTEGNITQEERET